MKRIALLILTNLAVILLISIITKILGIQFWMTKHGMNYNALIMFCIVAGFTGAFFSLMISKPMAKWTTGAKVIDGSEGPIEQWLIQEVRLLASKADIDMPEVAIYEGEPNAFATGPTKNSALIAVSTGLLNEMDREEITAVLAHEVAHAANSDMVTMTLIQGVMNTFVLFLARVIGYAVDHWILGRDEEESTGVGYFATVFITELVLGILSGAIIASFSRAREFRADEGAASLMGQPHSMIKALKKLTVLQNESHPLPESVKAFGINTTSQKWLSLLASHPPLEERIQALEAR